MIQNVGNTNELSRLSSFKFMHNIIYYEIFTSHSSICLFFPLGLLVNGCINVVITTIERRYGLKSTQTGLIAAGYDMASFVCLVPVTYFGGRKNASKPRWIGIGMVLMGLGSMVFSLPQFLVGSYKATSVEANVCLTEKTVGNTVSLDLEIDFLFYIRNQKKIHFQESLTIELLCSQKGRETNFIHFKR